MEYGSIIWDTYTKQEIIKLESIQRRGARYITKDSTHMKGREEGCMTKMLKFLLRNPSVELASLQVLFICSFHLRSSAICNPS
jgi:hypothetical protein